jgi:hypothetical protein
MHTYRSRIENCIFQAVLEQQDDFFDMDRTPNKKVHCLEELKE